jgi:hypothetical protein
MVIGIFVGGIFLGFSLGFVSARNNRLQGVEARETIDHLIGAVSPIREVNRSLPARLQVSGESCLLTPGS